MAKEGKVGFIWDLKKPTRDGYVTCLVITPMKKDGSRGADTGNKVERNLGRDMALQMALELLEHSGAPADLIRHVEAFRESVAA
jgi:hypothetical protein